MEIVIVLRRPRHDAGWSRLFNRRSIFGKAVVATASDRDAAGLMGIDTGLVITFSYALSSMAAAFAAC